MIGGKIEARDTAGRLLGWWVCVQRPNLLNGDPHGRWEYRVADGIVINAVAILQKRGRSVRREAFPPYPLPSLWRVDGGAELTEGQLVALAQQGGDA